MKPIVLAFIDLCFILLFISILTEIKYKKNIDLAFNVFLAIILMSIMKFFIFIYASYKYNNNCEFSKDIYCS